MNLSLFNRQSVLDEPSILWIFDLFGWGLQQFNGEVFFHETRLVTPSNDNFPGSADTVHGKAELIFDRVRYFAGVSHWPCKLVPPEDFNPGLSQRLLLQGPVRRRPDTVEPTEVGAPVLISYEPVQLRTPEILIANFAHILAHYMGSRATVEPPGGTENWPQATEILAVFMGFGLMFANTAFNLRGGGCCRGPVTERSNYLSEFDVTYALALFCVLKEIPNNAVLPYLKKTLRSYFKKAVKDVKGRAEELAMLQRL